ncbi:MAG: NAD-dependent epimerase/dehydratase family protein [Candidatus Omnitrophica bacterium]|nr:NAD-dependent epimerase/dehydratase family protein [Candidatus Omnitrophota bacterium]
MTELSKKCVLVTGATGFIGCKLCAALKEKGYFVRGAIRNNARDVSGVDEYIQVGDINESTDWQPALAEVDTVVHLAGRVHIMNDPEVYPIDAFRKVNVLGTERLARMAVKAGVRRLIFISSVKVNGEGFQVPYTERDVPAPQDAYGVSKREAEDSLACIANETGLQVVILRLPLVYGPGVKANFKNLIKLAGSGLPLPFKGINNQRSFLYLGNLVDAIITCISYPLAAGETFLVSDGQDVSTPDLIKMIAGEIKTRGRFCFSGKGTGKNRTVPCFLFYLHPGILKALCRIVGKGEELEKLTGSLLVDSSKIRNLLGWKPPFTLEEGIKEMVGIKA